MKRPVHQLPRKALSRPRSNARSGVALAKELVRTEFEKQRLVREMNRLRTRLSQCETEHAHNSEQALMCCAKLLNEDSTGD